MMRTAVVLAFGLFGSSVIAYDIEHVVVLVMENRPFDHFFGFAQDELPGIDGLVGNETNCKSSGDCASVADADASYVCTHGPSQAFSVFCNDFFGVDATDCASGPYPAQDMSGFLTENYYDEVMYEFKPEQLPVKTALAQEFAVFDKFYSSFPGPSTPNHLFIQTGSAQGCTATGATYHCEGGNFPGKTIYEVLEDNGNTWAYYYNDTAWNSFVDWFDTPRGAAGMQTYDAFYHAAEHGTLPNFSFVLPRQGTNKTTGQGPNDDHPCHDVALGELLLKDTYEAVRSGAGWNKTLMFLIYDDAGGFYDHSPLMTTGVPAPDDEPSCPSTTDYTYLGPRVPALMISPWVPKGTVVHAPAGETGSVFKPTEDSQYEHTSILSTVHHLFGTEAFLTLRDAWAAPVHDLLTEKEPRADCLVHTPDAPKASENAGTQSCGDHHLLTRRHKRRLAHYSKLNGVEVPRGKFDEDMSPSEAEEWIAEQELVHRRRLLEEL